MKASVPSIRGTRLGFQRCVRGLLLVTLFLLLCLPQTAQAYIGPGAGFALLSSFLIIFLTFLVTLFLFISWPVRFLLRLFRRKKLKKTHRRKVVVIGLDGMDPGLTQQFLDDGLLPHFTALRQKGCFTPLQTTYPSISPVAWSSFLTGANPARHNIFDFLSRDPRTYLLDLSSARVEKSSRQLNLGKYSIPLGKATIRLLRKSKPFWQLLGEHGIFSTVIRVPVTFPPEKFKGLLLSSMCVPDLKGTQGTFSFYTTRAQDQAHTGGERVQVERHGTLVRTYLSGPPNPLTRRGEELRLPMTVRLFPERKQAQLRIAGQRILLEEKKYSPWVPVTFRAGPLIKIRGICKFLLTELEPEFSLYMSAIHLDPERPALPISHPFIYSSYLSKLQGRFATLGLAEDTWALNERVIDEDAFLEQCYAYHKEREKMLFHAIEKTRVGLCLCVFDITDRVQHMFLRFTDEGHPAVGKEYDEKYTRVVREVYQRMDNMIGRVVDKLGEQDVVMVLSDHGFKSFRRGFNLNSWLYLNGYLALKNGDGISGEQFRDVDWSRTKAFGVGLSGLYINQKGREGQGIVAPGEEKEQLKQELIHKLSGLRDPEKGLVAITQVYDTAQLYRGPYLENAPDLLIGYNEGYRVSWDSVVGKVNRVVIEDNTRSWGGDHCIDPKLVPGVFFCNQKLSSREAHIWDLAPTVLNLFGLEPPSYMDGTPLFRGEQG